MRLPIGFSFSEIAPSEGFVDHRDRWRVGLVVGREIAADGQIYTHDAEIIWRRGPEVGHWAFVRRGGWSSFHIEAGRASAEQWHIGHRAGCANARQLADALEQTLKKRSLLRRLGVTRNGQRNGNGEDMIGSKTRIHLEQLNEAANQQTGRDQEDQ